MSITIIAGSRTITDPQTVSDAVEKSGFIIEKIITGGCNGVDIVAEQYAMQNNIPIEVFLADWKKYGRAAGPVRNKQMAEHADSLIAIMPEGGSKGTRSMILEAEKKGLKIYVHIVR